MRVMFAQAWVGCAALALKDGVGPIADLPGGVFDRKIGERWRIVLNGTDKPIRHSGADLPPFAVLIEFNGWPAGILDPSGGILAAMYDGGAAANEDSFIAAIETDLGCSVDDYFKQAEVA